MISWPFLIAAFAAISNLIIYYAGVLMVLKKSGQKYGHFATGVKYFEAIRLYNELCKEKGKFPLFTALIVVAFLVFIGAFFVYAGFIRI